MTTEQKVTRKLRAIMSADVKGYSLLMADDEVATVQTLKDYRDIMSARIEGYGGRVVDAVGDNLLAEFDSAVDAVQCAVEVQKELKAKNQELPEVKRLEFRIGINIGDVIQDGDSIFGDGVNIAARVEKLADAGGVCISRNAYDHIKKKLSLGYEFLGEHAVKNISEPVNVYKVLMDDKDAGKLIGVEKKAPKGRWLEVTAVIFFVVIGLIIYQVYQGNKIIPVKEASAEKPSIAILPFENMSNDPEQEYFSDGLTDELIGDLAKISGILVISRNSVFTYKGKAIKIQDIAKELNVRYILEGSVQKSGDKVRIRAQLIDGQTDHHLWSESYDGVLKDIFDLQDKITGKIISALAIKISPSEQERVADKGTDNVFAYEAFLKGEEQFIIQTPESFLKAIEYYKQAIEFDPNFSRAYAAVGNTYQIGGNLAYARKMGFSGGTMRLLARKYLEVAMKNPSPEAYSLAAAKEIHRRNFQKSITFAEKAHQYAPNSAGRMTALAWHLTFNGRAQESIELLNKTIRLDPVDTQKHTPICFLFLGVNHFVLGNMEEAVTYLQKALSLNPKLNNFSCFLAAAHAHLGNDSEAKKALADYLKIFPKGWPASIRFLYQAWPFKDSEVFDRLAQGMVKAGFPGDAADYYKLNSQERLNGKEIKNLLFGRTSSGYVWGIKPMHWKLHINDVGEVDYKYLGKTYTGKAWIEDENICLLREKYYDSLKSCEAIYRNPEGDGLTKTEYFRVTDYGLFLFSVEN